MRIQKALLLLAVVFVTSTVFAQEIPSGIILPVRLNSTLSSQKTKPGQPISARVAQDVPLADGMKIRAGTRLTGHVVNVQPGSQGNPPRISFVFDQVRPSKQVLPIKTDLRALASFTEVESAQLPLRSMGEGDSWDARTTSQVGGDVVYWGGGPVVGAMGIVGRPVTGTDSDVLGMVNANAEGHCRGEIDGHRGPQALWVFSSDACGVYGLDDVTISHAGRTEPVGLIELSSKSEKVKVPSGSGMLLRVIGDPQLQSH